MDCSEFRTRHLEITDATLDELTLVQAELHRTECEACAQFDTRVRRGLMVAHTLHDITPSGGFSAKLALRLADERLAQRRQRAVRGWAAVGGVCVLAIAAFAALPTHHEAERRFVGTGAAPIVLAEPMQVAATVSGPVDRAWPHDADSSLPTAPVVSIQTTYGNSAPTNTTYGTMPHALPVMLQATTVSTFDAPSAAAIDR
jgi:hypothetical protein